LWDSSFGSFSPPLMHSLTPSFHFSFFLSALHFYFTGVLWLIHSPLSCWQGFYWGSCVSDIQPPQPSGFPTQQKQLWGEFNEQLRHFWMRYTKCSQSCTKCTDHLNESFFLSTQTWVLIAVLEDFFVYVVLTDTSSATILTPGVAGAALSRRQVTVQFLVNFRLCLFPREHSIPLLFIHPSIRPQLDYQSRCCWPT